MFYDLYVFSKSCRCDTGRAIDQRIDIAGPAFQRPVGGEILHPVDQRGDAIHLVADELSQRGVTAAMAGFEKLRRATNARQRVLDLMRQDRRCAHGRARAAGRPAMADLSRLALRMNGHDAPAIMIDDRRDHQVHFHFRRAAGMDLDVIGGDGLIAVPDVEARARFGDADGARHVAADDRRSRHVEQRFRPDIGVGDAVVGLDDQRRHRQRRHLFAQRGSVLHHPKRRDGRQRAGHAALRSSAASRPLAISGS